MQILNFSGGQKSTIILHALKKKTLCRFVFISRREFAFRLQSKISRTPRAVADGLFAPRPRADVLDRAGTRPRERRRIDFAERGFGCHALQNGIRRTRCSKICAGSVLNGAKARTSAENSRPTIKASGWIFTAPRWKNCAREILFIPAPVRAKTFWPPRARRTRTTMTSRFIPERAGTKVARASAGVPNWTN